MTDEPVDVDGPLLSVKLTWTLGKGTAGAAQGAK